MWWPAFVRAQPELAAAAEALLAERHGYCYLATVDADGAPRVHPVAPILIPDGLFLAVQRRSAKRADLARDPRLALHCTVTPAEDEEVSVRGLARPVIEADRRERVARTATDGAELAAHLDLLEIDLTAVSQTSWVAGRPVHRRWRERPGDP